MSCGAQQHILFFSPELNAVGVPPMWPVLTLLLWCSQLLWCPSRQGLSLAPLAPAWWWVGLDPRVTGCGPWQGLGLVLPHWWLRLGCGMIDYWARESGVWFQPTGGWGQIPGQLAAGLGWEGSAGAVPLVGRARYLHGWLHDLGVPGLVLVLVVGRCW